MPQFLLPGAFHLPGNAGKVAFQLSLSLSNAPSLNAAPQSGDYLSGNRGEGAPESVSGHIEYPTAPKGQIFSGFPVIPGQSLMGETKPC